VPIRGVAGLSYHTNPFFGVGFAFSASDSHNKVQLLSVHLVGKVIEGAESVLASSRFDMLLGMDSISTLKIGRNGTFSFAVR
jgi:hypothetical protein